MPRVRRRQLCDHTGCATQPSFGFAGEKATRCLRHRVAGMTDVNNASKRCIRDGCTKQSTFGVAGTKTPKCCTKHKKDGMVDVTHPRCTHPGGCARHRTYGFENERPTRCASHMESGMVNVVSKRRCSHPGGCTTIPCFGLVGGKPTRCAEHKDPCMIDVVGKRCVHDGCTTRPAFGLVKGKPTHCVEHKEPGMIDVVSKRCVHNGCTTHPCFGLVAGKPTHCATHKSPGMEDVFNKRCKGPGDGRLCPRGERAYHKGLCFTCATVVGLKKSRKLTENRCLKVIKRAFGAMTETKDAGSPPGDNVTIQEQLYVDFRRSDSEGTCAWVDAYLSFPGVIRILLEIDELAHCRRGYSCDQRRMESVREAMLLQSVDARPIAWVRFNPDDPSGETSAVPRVQKQRCRMAVAVIRDLMKNPRNCIVYVNFPTEM